MPIKTQYTIEPVCPYCGQDQADAWELNFESDGEKREVDCIKCELPFTVQFNLAVTYSTTSLREKALKICAEEGLAVPESLSAAA